MLYLILIQGINNFQRNNFINFKEFAKPFDFLQV